MAEIVSENVKAYNKPKNLKVKIYLLNETGNWNDCGTGYLDFEKSKYGNGNTDTIIKVVGCNEES